jgi:hypothetical protein
MVSINPDSEFITGNLMAARIYLMSLLCLPVALPALPVQATEMLSVAQTLETVDGSRMQEDIRSLASPDMEGRQTGSVGDATSASFVEKRFRMLGFSVQQQQIKTTYSLIGTPLISVSSPASPQVRSFTARVKDDYLPVQDSPAVDITAPVVFAGYGISDPASGFDEYQSLDVSNRIVLFLRGKPDAYPKPVSHADKVRTARLKGAVAILTTTGPILSAYEARRGITGRPAAFYHQAPLEQSLPGAWISTEIAEKIVAAQGRSLRDLQTAINRSLAPQSRPTATSVTLKWESVTREGMLSNVIAPPPEQNQAAAPETIIVGAHRDHFGRQAGVIFPGADDNASGTAVMLEVARALRDEHSLVHRSLSFVSFSGEEQGLVGSRHYVRQPPAPLGTITAMINIDHVGIGNGRLTIGVTGLDKQVVYDAAEQAGLKDQVDVYGFFPGGDHVPFKEAGIPTITVVSSGVHPHFHQPTDTPDTIQPEIMVKAARFVLALIWRLSYRP